MGARLSRFQPLDECDDGRVTLSEREGSLLHDALRVMRLLQALPCALFDGVQSALP